MPGDEPVGYQVGVSHEKRQGQYVVGEPANLEIHEFKRDVESYAAQASYWPQRADEASYGQEKFDA